MAKYKINLKLENNEGGEAEEESFTPEYIVSELFYFHNQAHFNHLQTRSYAVHKALDDLYSELVTFKDSISELILGYIALKRLSSLTSKNIILILDTVLCDNIKTFAHELNEYAKMNEWLQLENISAELEGLAVKTKYLLTLNV